MSTFAKDSSKNIVIFINDFYPELPIAVKKLSKRLGRPLKTIMLIDKTAYDQGRYNPDKERVFDEVICDFTDPGALKGLPLKRLNRICY